MVKRRRWKNGAEGRSPSFQNKASQKRGKRGKNEDGQDSEKRQIWVPKSAPLQVTQLSEKKPSAVFLLFFFLLLAEEIKDGKRETGRSPLR